MRRFFAFSALTGPLCLSGNGLAQPYAAPRDQTQLFTPFKASSAKSGKKSAGSNLDPLFVRLASRKNKILTVQGMIRGVRWNYENTGRGGSSSRSRSRSRNITT